MTLVPAYGFQEQTLHINNQTKWWSQQRRRHLGQSRTRKQTDLYRNQTVVRKQADLASWQAGAQKQIERYGDTFGVEKQAELPLWQARTQKQAHLPGYADVMKQTDLPPLGPDGPRNQTNLQSTKARKRRQKKKKKRLSLITTTPTSDRTSSDYMKG